MSTSQTTTRSTAAQLIRARRILVVAHRGDSSAAPENTLPAFESAVRAGADVVELDYHESSDGVPLAFHDVDLDRTTDAARVYGHGGTRLAEKRLSELKALDAGGWFSGDFQGVRIPMLVEALQVICPMAVAAVECKAGSAERLVELLETHRWAARVVVMSFDWPFLARCRQLEPGLVLGALSDEPFDAAALDEALAAGAQVVGWEERFLDVAAIEAIHARGLAAWAWTVDDEVRFDTLAAAGIDAITTNRPAALKAHLSAGG